MILDSGLLFGPPCTREKLARCTRANHLETRARTEKTTSPGLQTCDQFSIYIGWRWRHFNDFIYVYRCYGHTGGTHGFARVERNTQRFNLIVPGTAEVKLAHKSEGSRHKIFSDFREIRSVQRNGQQLFGVWPSRPSSTQGYASCILF